MKTLRYCGYDPTAKGFGWATCNANLREALREHFILTEADGADVDFVPIADHAMNPVCTPTAEIRLGFTFFEFPLEPDARANAEQFDTLFVGSAWCKRKLAEIGVENTRVLMQGVDGTIFKPQPPRAPDGTFRIFSGGKFEYRKGQDLVIAAFREFAKSHPEAHLVCSWFNPWPQLTRELLERMGIRIDGGEYTGKGWREVLSWSMVALGIPRDRFTILPQLNHADLAREMANTDIGLFPNRCEGGTNLVAMEYLSCGRPIAANVATGHHELAEAGPAIHIIPHGTDAIGWATQEVSDIVRTVAKARALPIQAVNPPRWTWQAAAQAVADEVARIDSQK